MWSGVGIGERNTVVCVQNRNASIMFVCAFYGTKKNCGYKSSIIFREI